MSYIYVKECNFPLWSCPLIKLFCWKSLVNPTSTFFNGLKYFVTVDILMMSTNKKKHLYGLLFGLLDIYFSAMQQCPHAVLKA